MRVSEIMERDIEVARPQQTLGEVAHLMLERDLLVLPVQDGDRLVGLISCRDIAVRAAAEGKGAASAVGEVMTREVKYCFQDDDPAEVRHNFRDLPLRRLPVLDRGGRLVGVLALSAALPADRRLGRALRQFAGGQPIVA